MKRQILPIITFSLVAGIMSSQGQTPMPTPMPTPASTNDFSKIFKSDRDKNSYAIGMNTGQGIKSTLARTDLTNDVNMEMIIKGFTDEVAGSSTLVTEEQEHAILGELMTVVRAKMGEKQKQLAEENRIKGEKNLVEGKAFLEKNKTATGVQTLADGLEYIIEKDGSGASPKPDDSITVSYVGTLIDGTEFDSSAKHGGTYTTRANASIKGWNEAVQMMKPGSKWKIFVPAELGYGLQARGPVIGPDSTLVFEIELISVTPGKTAEIAPHPATVTPLTSDIIKVPSQSEMAKGAKIETIKAEDLEKERAKSTNQ